MTFVFTDEGYINLAFVAAIKRRRADDASMLIAADGRVLGVTLAEDITPGTIVSAAPGYFRRCFSLPLSKSEYPERKDPVIAFELMQVDSMPCIWTTDGRVEMYWGQDEGAFTVYAVLEHPSGFFRNSHGADFESFEEVLCTAERMHAAMKGKS